MSNVIIKLVSGEELFANIEAVGEDHITISKPMRITKKLMETKAGYEAKIMYEPWMDYSEIEEHIVHNEHMIICEPLKDFHIQFYAEMIENIAEMKDTTDKNLRMQNIKLH